MSSPARAGAAPSPLRLVRAMEATYALIALVIVLALPWPPTPASSAQWVHWTGSAILAALLAVRLARPTRAAWWVAVVLAGYVIANTLLTAARLFRELHGATPGARAIAVATSALVFLTQVVALAGLYREWGIGNRE